MTDQVHLRPLRLEDERAASAASADLHDYSFFLWNDDDLPWDRYIELLANYRRGIDLPIGRVKSTFLVAEVDGNMVGRAAIRHELNEFLATVGGHIGYAVLPRYRRRGFATQILRQSVEVARSLGIERILVTCDEDNVASARVIEKCGGAFEGLVADKPDLPRKRRYWID